MYGATKLAQEHILDVWGGSRGVPISILRLQNVYGVGQSLINSSYTGIVSLFSQWAREGRSIPLYEDGNIVRDFVYIDDVVEAIAQTILAGPTFGRPILDAGTGVDSTIGDLANVIAAYYSAPPPQVNGKFRDGDVRSASCVVDVTEANIAWAPTWTLEAGIAALQPWLEQELIRLDDLRLTDGSQDSLGDRSYNWTRPRDRGRRLRGAPVPANTVPTAVTDRPRSLVVQSVLYGNAFDDIERAVAASVAAVTRAVDRGLVDRWEIRLGDCSPEPVLDAPVTAGLADLVEGAGGRLSVTVFGANLGSAAGHNALAAESDTEVLLILNPDAIVSPFATERLLLRLDAATGMVEARQVPIEHPKDYDAATGDTLWASTACAVTSRDVFDEVGGFDAETFFLYCDDVDYSWRVRPRRPTRGLRAGGDRLPRQATPARRRLAGG